MFSTSILYIHTRANRISATEWQRSSTSRSVSIRVCSPRRKANGACADSERLIRARAAQPDARNIFKPFEITSGEVRNVNRFSRAVSPAWPRRALEAVPSVFLQRARPINIRRIDDVFTCKGAVVATRVKGGLTGWSSQQALFSFGSSQAISTSSDRDVTGFDRFPR